MSLLCPNLQAFMAVARGGTVHGAARELHLTQTGVTQRVRAAERLLGITLFLRSRKGMRLTPEGDAPLRYCEGAEDLEGRVLSEISGAGKNRPAYLTLAGPTSVMTARIPDLCADLYFHWPNLYLSFNITDATDRVNLVRQGAASLAIVPPEQAPNEMEQKRLAPDKYLLVGSPSWKGRRLSDILQKEKVIDFDERDPTTLNYLKKFGLLEKLKNPRLFVNNNQAIVKYFSRGVGFGTLTQEIAASHLSTGELITLNGGAVMEDPLTLIWYARPEMPPYFKALIAAIK